jgi:branched-chain amino acid transport system permease protein
MEYLIHLAILIAIYAGLATSLNLVVGYTGILSITHAAFYGIGGYATAILLTGYNVNFFVSVIIGAIFAALSSFIIGWVLSKFKDDYYALGSFGFNIIVYSIFLNWQGLTRGPLGIPGIDRPSIFGFEFSENIFFLILSAVIVGVIYLISLWIVNSSFGRALKGIREDEEALQVFGYKTPHFKQVIFAISAGMAAVCGSIYATYITFIDPSTFGLNESIFILAIIILGGLASTKGAFIGAVFLILLPEILRFVGFPTDIAAQMRQVVYGLLLIFLMLYRPRGIVGEFEI